MAIAVTSSEAPDQPDAAGKNAVSDGREIAPLLIHIGFHKTGSTWLQQELLDNPAFGFTTQTGETRQQIIMRVGVPDPLSYDATAVASHYAPAIDEARKSGLTLALSHERLSGHPSSGGRDRCMIADRLKSTFPESRILIVFREQRSLIQSMYSQHISAGGVESLRRYLTTPEPGWLRKPSFAFELYEFDTLIRYYQQLFGTDRVLALPLELLQARPAEFASRISTFCGHPPVEPEDTRSKNVRRPQLMQLVQRPLNMLFFHNDLSPGALLHVTRFHMRYGKYARPLFNLITPKVLDDWILRRQRRIIDSMVGNRYAVSNRRTQEIVGLPLADLGYPVS
ncbi:MAG TPA: hypothetical protein VHN55_07725 [Sphingomicrobium sp.]|nr:hypothetical protein [Sphingomicrobium sp.]